MPKKVVVLTGAGFATIWNAPSTSKLTNIIREDKLFHSYTDQSLGDWIYHKLSGFYHHDVASINFETVLNYIENLHSFFQSKFGRGRIEFRNALSAFLEEKEVLNEILAFHRIYEHKTNSYRAKMGNSFEASWSDFDYFFDRVYAYYTQLVTDEIAKYSESYNSDDFITSNDGLNEFVKYLLDNFESVNWYSTNYDRIVPTVFDSDFFEGFTQNESGEYIFNSVKTLKGGKRTYYNIHGSIYFDRNFPNGLQLTPDIPNRYPSSSGFKKDQEGKSILSSNIITGLNKSSAILSSPFSEFYHRFYQDCLDCDLFIIIGYSFSDIHINKAIAVANESHGRQMLKIVDYMIYGDEQLDEEHEFDWVDNNKRYAENFIDPDHGFYRIINRANESNFSIFRKGMGEFLKRKEWLEFELP